MKRHLGIFLAATCLALSSPAARATVTASLHAGTGCSGASSAAFTAGTPQKVSLCVTTTSERSCGFSYYLRAASEAENDRFSVTGRTMAAPYDFSNLPDLPFPLSIAVAGTADLGAGTTTGMPVAPGAGQLVATLDITPGAGTTSGTYVISLRSGSVMGVDAGDNACGAPTGAPLAASFTFTSGGGPAPFDITSAPATTFRVTEPGSFTFTASGPVTQWQLAGTLPAGVNFNAGTLAGAPASGSAGTYAVNVTATHAGGALTRPFVLTVERLSQSITFNTVASAAAGGPAITLVATAGSAGPVTFASQTPAQCTVSANLLTPVAAGTCQVTASQAGTLDHAPAPTVTRSITITGAGGDIDYTDMWWAGAAQNGWGVSITQHGTVQFSVIFAYDNTGRGVWYVMPGGTWDAVNRVFTGALYQPTSAPFNAYDTTRFVPGAPVGTVSFRFTTASTAVMTYTINGIAGTKNIERQVFNTEAAVTPLLVRDMWWPGAVENGWGINIAQQGGQLFPVWYTYDAEGRTTFFAVPGGTWTGTAFTGDVYATTSSGWLGVDYDTTRFVATRVGTMTLNFADRDRATMTYTVNGITQSKQIVRQPF